LPLENEITISILPVLGTAKGTKTRERFSRLIWVPMAY